MLKTIFVSIFLFVTVLAGSTPSLAASCLVTLKLDGVSGLDFLSPSSRAELIYQSALDLKAQMEKLPALDNHLLVSTTTKAKEQRLDDLGVQSKVDLLTSAIVGVTEGAILAGKLDQSLEKTLLYSYYTIKGEMDSGKGYFAFYGLRMNETDSGLIYDFLISDDRQEKRSQFQAKKAEVRKFEQEVQALQQPAVDLKSQMEKLPGLDNYLLVPKADKAKRARIEQWGIQSKIDGIVSRIRDVAERAQRGGYLTEDLKRQLLAAYYVVSGEVNYSNKGYFTYYGLGINAADNNAIYFLLISAEQSVLAGQH
jgi:hypothetical protein